MTQSRITQAAVEAVTSPTPPTRLTQLAAEVVTLPTPPSRLTQLAVEVLVSERPRSRITQLALEVLVPNAPASDLGGTTGQLWPRGGDALPGVGNIPGGSAGGDLGGTYPDPTVTAIQGMPVSTTDPTTGQALVWNGTLYVPTTLAGGSSFTMFDPDKPPASLANSIKFDGTDAAPTAINLGTTTYDINTSKPRSLVVVCQDAAGWRGLLWPLPGAVSGSDFTMWCRVRIAGNGNNYILGGIVLKDSTNTSTGRMLGWQLGYNSDAGFGHWPAYAEISTGFSASGHTQPHSAKNLNLTEGILAIRRVGTNYTVEVSQDGRTVQKSGNIAHTTIGGGPAWTPTHYGVSFYRASHADHSTHTYGPVYLELSGTAAIGGDRTIALAA